MSNVRVGKNVVEKRATVVLNPNDVVVAESRCRREFVQTHFVFAKNVYFQQNEGSFRRDPRNLHESIRKFCVQIRILLKKFCVQIDLIPLTPLISLL